MNMPLFKLEPHHNYWAPVSEPPALLVRELAEMEKKVARASAARACRGRRGGVDAEGEEWR